MSMTPEERAELCALVPSDPVCQEQPKPEPTDQTKTDGGDMQMHDGGMMGKNDPWEMRPMPMEGQITYTMVAVFAAVGYALELFKWRSDANFYNDGDTAWESKTNWWKLYN